MDSRQLLARAEHALRTGQPNLAALYMRRARERNRQEVLEQRRQRSTISFLQALVVARLNTRDAAQPLIDFLDAFTATPPTRNHYALAGPSKGEAPA